MKREIMLRDLENMSTDTFSRKTKTTKGIETVSINELRIGDKVMIDDYFHTIVEISKNQIKS